MFRRAQRNEVFWPVVLPDRQPDGTTQQTEIQVCFRIFNRAEFKARKERLQAIAARMAEARVARDLPAIQASLAEMKAMQDDDEAELRDRLVDWKGVIVSEEDPSPLAFSPEDRDWLLSDEARYQILRSALYEASRGAVAKN